IIQQTLTDRPNMLRSFNDMFFFQHVTQPLSDWFFQLGLVAAGWSTVAGMVSLRDETLFADLGKITVPTLILHGIHDRICPFPFAETMDRAIRDAKLVPFEFSGHGLF
ncbi:alpha/beta fold hydrolase, partial [Mycobacterium tuberculosis]|uniref:alpha/beta fold hydrolase n=1 Tax=Mycobacterium tuberculosis TaxID=1773 RepID=UPI000A652726